MKPIFLFFFACLFSVTGLFAQADFNNYDVKVVQQESQFNIQINAQNADGIHDFWINGETQKLEFKQGIAQIPIQPTKKGKLYVFKQDKKIKIFHFAQRKNGTIRSVHIPLWYSIIPPLIAIILALVFKEVVISLFSGVWAGAFIAGGLRLDSFFYLLQSFWHVLTKYIVLGLYNTGHISVLVFSVMIGGMVAIISRNGGMAGVVNSLTRYARTPRSAQFITWLLGIAIFFDDYANTLIVGNTMRPVTDKFKISREKLSFIVDATAAPVSAIAFVTTWIGAELGYIDSGLTGLANFNSDLTPYAVFLASLKYSFYPIFTLGFILLLIRSQKDFGPMYHAELRARTTGAVSAVSDEDVNTEDMEDLNPIEGAPLRWYNAALPVLTVIIVTLFGLIHTGMEVVASDLAAKGVHLPTGSWREIWQNIGLLSDSAQTGTVMKVGKIIGSADSYVALLWASASGIFVASALTIGGRIMGLKRTMDTLLTGFKAIMPALVILTLAWALAMTTKELHTADFLTEMMRGSVSPYMVPAIIFVLAAVISFSTGSSWSTMAILYPIAIPTTWAVSHAAGLPEDVSLEILFNVVATVLAASVVGDHCSPISDTTILSSLATKCNHIDHVRTQMPYALTIGAISLTSCTLAAYLGGGALVSGLLFMGGFIAMYLIIRFLGKRTDVA